jgi:tetratricopeptide (TPR) repeat protein
MSEDHKKIKLFISYSHDDEDYFKVFSELLKKAVKNAEHYEWDIWDDRNIYVGTFWDDEIQNNIKNCNVALLLVSLGFMASTYIKEKEFKIFTTRYADKGILIIPIIFKPCDFNRWDDLSKLQFFKPDGSNYGKAEIENFTYADLIKFRETDGNLIPNPNSDRYILDLVKRIEESFQDFLNKKENKEISYFTKADTGVNKLSDYPKPGNLFTGRKKEIEEFQTAFRSFRIFAIEGLGGTGKTQFASKCIEETFKGKSKIIWLNGSAQSNFDVFVESSGYGDVLKGEKKTDLALYSGLKDLIERDERIIFWDNYNEYDDLSFSKFLSFANQYLQKATVILITKVDPSITGITSLPIVKLEGLEDDAIEYAKKLRSSNVKYSAISDSDLVRICNGVDGHPLAIEFSMLLMGYGKSADDIMHHMAQFSGLKKVEDFSKRLFLDILYHPSTSSEERECFLKCSVFRERITEGEIKFLYDGRDVFSLLAGLIDKLLITFKDGFYDMHPLVRSFSYEKLTDKKIVHKKAADYFISLRAESLNASLEEKIFYHLSAAQEWETIADAIQLTGRTFIHQGQLSLLNEFMNKLIGSKISRQVFEIFYGDTAQIKGEWDKALEHFENASRNTNDNQVKTEGMIKYGEILFRRGDVNESLRYFEIALKFAKEQFYLKEEARALNDIGLVYFESDELEKAYEKHSAALKIRIKIGDNEGIAFSYNNIANIFNKNKRYTKALEYYSRSVKISESLNDKINLGIYLMNISDVLKNQNKLEDALVKINLALIISESIGDKSSISFCLNMVGLIFLMQEKSNKALSKYMEALKIREEIGDKRGTSESFCNIGSFYFQNKDYEQALFYLFSSLGLFSKIGKKGEKQNVLAWINLVLNELGSEKFRELAIKAYKELNLDIQKEIQLSNFFDEPSISSKSEFKKVNRNDPCPCGSGKKYKQCHGKN